MRPDLRPRSAHPGLGCPHGQLPRAALSRLLDVRAARRRGGFDLPDSRSMAGVSPAVTNWGALSRFEAHELFESSDLTAIAGRAQGSPTGRPVPGRRGGLPSAGTGEGCSVMADTATVSAIQARQPACNSLTMRHVRWADSAALGDYIRRSAPLLGRRCCARKSHLNGCYGRAMSRFCCD